MGRIEWNESLRVCVDELDNQHRELIRLYNNLHESLMNDPLEKTIRTKISTLNALLNYTLHHFTAEESYLASRGFPTLAHHQRLHREFSGKILSLQQDLTDNAPVLATSLIKFLRNWILDHVGREDQVYAQYLRQQITAP